MIEIVEGGVDTLADYASISSAYRVMEVVDLDTPAAASSALPYATTMIAAPFTKDYDALPGNHPLDWPTRFDISDWRFLSAHIGARRVGGSIVIPPRTTASMIDGLDNSAVLWDIRVAPMARSSGVGTALLAASEAWARGHGASTIGVETQNTNVPACRFYARAGYSLREIRRGAYAELPDEVQLVWIKDLV